MCEVAPSPTSSASGPRRYSLASLIPSTLLGFPTTGSIVRRLQGRSCLMQDWAAHTLQESRNSGNHHLGDELGEDILSHGRIGGNLICSPGIAGAGWIHSERAR